MRFAVFFSLLWSLFLFAADTYYCPMHCEGTKTYSAPGACPVCQMHLIKKGDETDENAPLSLRDYRVDLTTDPGELKAGVEGRIQLTPRLTQDNAILRDLEEVHGAEMEVYATPQDLSAMERIRPTLLADGTFSIKHTFEKGGNYILYVVLTPKGKRTQIFPMALKIGGPAKKTRLKRTHEVVTSFKDRVKMTSPALFQSGQKVPLSFSIERAESKKKLPVVKEYAYAIVISSDTTRFIPIHSAIQESSKGKWRVQADVKFPKAGTYLVFLELWNTAETVSFEVAAK